jgi:hypothetical protein
LFDLYTLVVNPIVFTIFKIATVLSFVVILRYGFIAATESEGPRKSRARLVASLIFSLWFCITPVLKFLYDQSLPVFESSGEINSVQVLNSDSKHYSAYLHLNTTAGGEITVHASDRSPRFRAGQQLKVRYRGDTGELIKASFFAADGNREGTFNSTLPFEESAILLVGLFCTWASIRKYRRDLEGSET